MVHAAVRRYPVRRDAASVRQEARKADEGGHLIGRGARSLEVAHQADTDAVVVVVVVGRLTVRAVLLFVPAGTDLDVSVGCVRAVANHEVVAQLVPAIRLPMILVERRGAALGGRAVVNHDRGPPRADSPAAGIPGFAVGAGGKRDRPRRHWRGVVNATGFGVFAVRRPGVIVPRRPGAVVGSRLRVTVVLRALVEVHRARGQRPGSGTSEIVGDATADEPGQYQQRRKKFSHSGSFCRQTGMKRANRPTPAAFIGQLDSRRQVKKQRPRLGLGSNRTPAPAR